MSRAVILGYSQQAPCCRHSAATGHPAAPPPPPLRPPPRRAQSALVCRRWAALTRAAAALWECVELSLTLPDAAILERIECFLAWLIPRAAAVEKLTIVAERGEAPPSPSFGPLQLQLVWSNLVSALTLMGPTLRHLAIDWPDDLQLSAWMATLVALEVSRAALLPPRGRRLWMVAAGLEPWGQTAHQASSSDACCTPHGVSSFFSFFLRAERQLHRPPHHHPPGPGQPGCRQGGQAVCVCVCPCVCVYSYVCMSLCMCVCVCVHVLASLPSSFHC